MRDWFFVRRLPADAPERASGADLQIQKLDIDGLAEDVVDIPVDAVYAELLGIPVPTAVIEAARRQATGRGDYVDPEGRSVPPF